jgi:hypothetical protein
LDGAGQRPPLQQAPELCCPQQHRCFSMEEGIVWYLSNILGGNLR